MKTCLAVSVALLLLLAIAVAQEPSPATANAKSSVSLRKTVTIKGQLGDDSRWVLRDADGRTWTVSDAGALRGHAGQEVLIRCQILPEKNELQVISIKPAQKPTESVTNWGDSAFRR